MYKERDREIFTRKHSPDSIMGAAKSGGLVYSILTKPLNLFTTHPAAS
jgi:hypothetical protein